MKGLVNEEEIEIDLDGLVHDRVAIQYALMQDLLTGDAEEHYVLFDIDEFKTLIVRNVGEREVRTPALTTRIRPGGMDRDSFLALAIPLAEAARNDAVVRRRTRLPARPH